MDGITVGGWECGLTVIRVGGDRELVSDAWFLLRSDDGGYCSGRRNSRCCSVMTIRKGKSNHRGASGPLQGMAAKKATISARAKAKTNTGILHQVQDDGCFVVKRKGR